MGLCRCDDCLHEMRESVNAAWRSHEATRVAGAHALYAHLGFAWPPSSSIPRARALRLARPMAVNPLLPVPPVLSGGPVRTVGTFTVV